MAELKTRKNEASVDALLSKISPPRRSDATSLVVLFERAIGAPARMWGTSIVGFGDRSYANKSGKATPWFAGGFSPRAQNFTLYLSNGGLDTSGPLFAKLGKHSTGKGCLYIDKLTDVDVDVDVLEAIVRAAAATKVSHASSSKAAPTKAATPAKTVKPKAKAPKKAAVGKASTKKVYPSSRARTSR